MTCSSNITVEIVVHMTAMTFKESHSSSITAKVDYIIYDVLYSLIF